MRVLKKGYIVAESAISKPVEFYLLLVNCGEGRRSTTERTVEVR